MLERGIFLVVCDLLQPMKIRQHWQENKAAQEPGALSLLMAKGHEKFSCD